MNCSISFQKVFAVSSALTKIWMVIFLTKDNRNTREVTHTLTQKADYIMLDCIDLQIMVNAVSVNDLANVPQPRCMVRAGVSFRMARQ